MQTESPPRQPERPSCEVCQQRPAVGIAGSQLGPLSLAYCQECLEQRAEPFWLVEATLEQIGQLANGASWLRQIHTFRDGRYLDLPEAEQILQQQLLKRLRLCPVKKDHPFLLPRPTCGSASTRLPGK